jgi:hypothetical protein
VHAELNLRGQGWWRGWGGGGRQTQLDKDVHKVNTPCEMRLPYYDCICASRHRSSHSSAIKFHMYVPPFVHGRVHVACLPAASHSHTPAAVAPGMPVDWLLSALCLIINIAIKHCNQAMCRIRSELPAPLVVEKVPLWVVVACCGGKPPHVVNKPLILWLNPPCCG